MGAGLENLEVAHNLCGAGIDSTDRETDAVQHHGGAQCIADNFAAFVFERNQNLIGRQERAAGDFHLAEMLDYWDGDAVRRAVLSHTPRCTRSFAGICPHAHEELSLAAYLFSPAHDRLPQASASKLLGQNMTLHHSLLGFSFIFSDVSVLRHSKDATEGRSIFSFHGALGSGSSTSPLQEISCTT